MKHTSTEYCLHPLETLNLESPPHTMENAVVKGKRSTTARMPQRLVKNSVTRTSLKNGPNTALSTTIFKAAKYPAIPTKTFDRLYLEHPFKNLGVLDDLSAGLGTLFKLPPEIRHIIYRKLLREGSVEVLQTSKRIYEEAAYFRFEDGTCFMTVGIPKRSRPWRPDLSLMFSHMDLIRYIQRVHLRVKSQCGEAEVGLNDYEFLNLFSGSRIPRKMCTVEIIVYPSTKRMVRSWLLKKLVPLTGFEKVVLDLQIEWIWEPFPSILGPQVLRRIYGRFCWGTNFTKMILEPALGPATLVPVGYDAGLWDRPMRARFDSEIMGRVGEYVEPKNRTLRLVFFPRQFWKLSLT